MEDGVAENTACTENELDGILQKYAGMVYRIAFARTKNAADADDVMQDVFFKYIKARRPVADGEHLKAWLIRVTVNLSNNLLKSAWFRHTAPLSDNLPARPEPRNEVLEAVLGLPLKYRTAVHLFYYEDMSVAEIGRAVGARETTVRTWLLRARKLLKEQLGEEYGDD